MSKPTLQAVINQILRASSTPSGSRPVTTGIIWAPGAGDGVGNPYYHEAPEPPPIFPTVVFDIPDDSTVSNFFEGGYEEEYKVVVEVYGTQEDIATVLTPYSSTSVLYFLDWLTNNKSLLAGDNFKVSSWFRDGWSLTQTPQRAPTGNPPPGDPSISGGRVWLARATYSATVLFNELG